MDISDDEAEDLYKQLEDLGEEINEDEWELIHSERINDPDFDFDMESLSISASPNQDSSQDQNPYKVRYAYMPMRKSPDSRNFCIRMEDFTGRNIVFRKEDINMMSFRGVNKELGHKRRNYSLFKFKGGKNCHHYWELRVYKSKVNPQDRVSENSIKPVNNPKEVPIRPVDLPGRGAFIM